jgi:hypothetical protein
MDDATVCNETSGSVEQGIVGELRIKRNSGRGRVRGDDLVGVEGGFEGDQGWMQSVVMRSAGSP